MSIEKLELNEKFNFDGHSIAWGTMGKGEPAVLIHGWPFSSQVWRKIAPILAEERQVFFFDLLGFGYSDKPLDTDTSLGIQNHVWSALYKHWGLKNPDVVAHDFGGATALRGHILNGLDYNSLVLIDPVSITPVGSSLVVAAKAHESVFTQLPAYVHEAIARAYIANAVETPLQEDNMHLYLDQWLGEQGQKSFWRQVAQIDDIYTSEVEHRYNESRCSTSILWGEKDEWIKLDDGKEFSKRITHEKFVIVPNSKHLVQEDAVEAVIAEIIRHWNKMK